MSQKDKNHNLEKTIRKTIRQINGFKVRTGKTPTGTAPKVSVTRVWPPKKEIILQWTSDSVRLPTKDNPIIVQQLTQAQIDAIPRDRFAVAVIGPTKLTAPTFVVVPGTGEQLFLTFITHLDELKKDGNDIFALIRNHTRNGGDDIPPENEMFLPPIDDNKMSDCIMRVILHFFGNNDKAKVHGYELKLSEFCVLIHYYFLRINVLKKNGRKPFCEYLEKKCSKRNWISPSGHSTPMQTIMIFINWPIPAHCLWTSGIMPKKKNSHCRRFFMRSGGISTIHPTLLN